MHQESILDSSESGLWPIRVILKLLSGIIKLLIWSYILPAQNSYLQQSLRLWHGAYILWRQ
jgi:hypothetical protein